MIEILTLLAKSMRLVMLGPNKPNTWTALRTAGIASAALGEAQAAVVDKTDGIKAHLDTLAKAVFEGKSYSQFIGPEAAAKTAAKVVEKWDAACTFTPDP